MGNDDAWVIMEESRVTTNISQILKRFCPPFNRLTLCYLVDPFNACNRGTKTGLNMRSSLSRSQDDGKQQVAQQGKHKFADWKRGCPLGHARDNNPQQGKNEFILTRDAGAPQASQPAVFNKFCIAPLF
jgi:hypothetical protein